MSGGPAHYLRPEFWFDVLARGFAGAMGGSGESKGTPLELFADGILELQPEIRELIRAAA